MSVYRVKLIQQLKYLTVKRPQLIFDYYRLSGDKRLLFGGGTVYGGVELSNIEAKLRGNMDKVFPQLKGVKVEYTWSGNFTPAKGAKRVEVDRT